MTGRKSKRRWIGRGDEAEQRGSQKWFDPLSLNGSFFITDVGISEGYVQKGEKGKTTMNADKSSRRKEEGKMEGNQVARTRE